MQNEFILFLVAATALLGSPGPAIAALLAVGRTTGWRGGVPFYVGLQLGLAAAAGVTIIGVFAVVSSFPGALIVLTVVGTAYLLYLAYSIATSPVGNEAVEKSQASGFFGGILIGITNPKAYLAFASLFASFEIFAANSQLDGLAKWLGVIFVMIVVDLIWLWIGVRIGQLTLSHKAERTMNIVLALAIVVAAVLALM